MRTALATAYAAATTRRATAPTARPQLVVVGDAAEPVIPETLAFLSDPERAALDLVLQRSERALRRLVRRRVMREVLALDEVVPPRPPVPAANDAEAEIVPTVAPATPRYQHALLAWETEGVDPTGRSDERVAARLGRRLSGAALLALHIGLFAKRVDGAWIRTLARKHARVAAVLRRARSGDARAVLIARLARQAARDRILGHIRSLDHELRRQARRDLACFERAIGRRFEGAEARAVLIAITTVQRWLHLRAGAARAPFAAMLAEFIPAPSRACVEAALA